MFATREAVWALLGVLLCQVDSSSTADGVETMDLEQFRPLEEQLLTRFLEEGDGPFKQKIKELLVEYLVLSTIESVTGNNMSFSEIDQNSLPPKRNRQNSQHDSSEEVTDAPMSMPPMTTKAPAPHTILQPIFIHLPQPAYPPPPQYQPLYNPYYPPYNPQLRPVQQLPPYQHQHPHPQQPAFQPLPPPPQSTPTATEKPAHPPSLQQSSSTKSPQDFFNLKNSGEEDEHGPNENGVVDILWSPAINLVGLSTTAPTQPLRTKAPQMSMPSPPPVQPTQPPVPPAPTPPVPVGPSTPVDTSTVDPTTTLKPTSTPEYVYDQVYRLLGNAHWINIPRLVDHALRVRTSTVTRHFVNGILKTVFCNPVNGVLASGCGHGHDFDEDYHA